MKVIVVGAGFTGVQLARSLADSGAEVVLVENDPDKARVAREQVDCAVLEADGNSPATLAEAGGSTVHAWQNLWNSAYKAVGRKVFYTSKKKQYRTFAVKGGTAEGDAAGLAPRMALSLKITPKGSVTATLTYDTGKRKKDWKVYHKPTCSTVVIPTSAPDAETFTGEVYLYFAPSAANNFGGYAGSIAVSRDSAS